MKLLFFVDFSPKKSVKHIKKREKFLKYYFFFYKSVPYIPEVYILIVKRNFWVSKDSNLRIL